MDPRLIRLRLELWSAPQILRGDDLREFWNLIKGIWESREALLINTDLTLAEVDAMEIG